MPDDSIIVVRSLHYSYPDGTKALRDISFTVKRGESVGIIGPNGAGKSTLLLHLNGHIMGGDHVLIDGQAVEKRNLADIRRKVGIVFQEADIQLFMLTVFDDVAFGLLNMGIRPEEVRERAARALAAVGMSGYEDRAPYHLSGGEKRAAAIATVLAMDPQVLIMDEPTSNLDMRTRRQVIAILEGLHMTKRVASHDLEMILRLCRRTILIEKGGVVADGETVSVLEDEALLEKHGLEVPLSLKYGAYDAPLRNE